MKRRQFIFSDISKGQLRAIAQNNALEILRKLDRFELTGTGDQASRQRASTRTSPPPR